MDIIILGFLMMKHSTIYEIRGFIEAYLTSVSSNSTGSIQAGIKKLVKNEMITFKEQVENSVNKKIYSITEAGKKYFLERLSSPMLYREKNMEWNKLFFMGFIDKEQQIKSIDNYIGELEQELEFLNCINLSLNPRYGLGQDYVDDVKQNSGAPELITQERVHEIAKFQYAVLDLGIDKVKFEIEWFSSFKEKLETGGNSNESE